MTSADRKPPRNLFEYPGAFHFMVITLGGAIMVGPYADEQGMRPVAALIVALGMLARARYLERSDQ